MVQMLDGWTLTTPSVKCFLGLQYIGFQHLWGFFKLQCPTPPHPKNNVWHMYPKVFPSSNSCGFNIIKVGRGERTARFFPKGSNIFGENLKITDYYKYCITDPKTFVQFCESTTGFDVWERSAEIPYWCQVTTQIWVVLLIDWSKFPTLYDKSEASPRWIVKHHQYGISALIS